MYAVDIRHLVKDFKNPLQKKLFRAVDGVSITIKPGEVYGLIGPNGSGKSTTMKALLNLLTPTAGTCRIFGKDASRIDARSSMGFLPENPYFYKHLTGEETLKFYGKLCNLRGKVLRQRIEEMLDLVDLQQARHRRIKGYSKGMLQRIGLAQALIHKPKMVILDEPTAGVDPVGSRMIRDMILKLKKEGVTIFLCSHLLEQVQEVCDRVGIIFNGKIVREGAIDNLLAIDERSEITLENLSPADEAKLITWIKANTSATIVSTSKAKQSLEDLFIQYANQQH